MVSPACQQVLDAALKLPPDDRAALLRRLSSSVEEPIDPEIEAAWIEEAKRRVEADDRGEVAWHDGQEVIRRLREKYSS